MNSSALKGAANLAVRTFWTSARVRSAHAGGKQGGVVPSASSYKKIQQLQNLMLADDGRLVWQKRGAIDKTLYLSTVALCAAGTAYAIYLVVYMSFPHKKPE